MPTSESTVSPAGEPKHSRVAFAEIVTLALYAAAVVTISLLHEPWRDEADCWLVARDATLTQMFHRMGLSGTPGLWHLILVPFAKGGFPYATQAVLHVAIAIASAAVLLRLAPFPTVTKIALLASYYFAFEYSVIVRSYALSVLLLFVIAALYPRRFEMPLRFGFLVALLANTNAHSLFIAAFLGAVYASEALSARKLEAARGAALILAGGLAAVAQLIPAQDAISGGLVLKHVPDAALLAVTKAFVPIPGVPGSWIVGCAVIIAATIDLRRNRSALLLLWGTYAALAYLLTSKWIGGLRHSGFFLLMLLFVLWIDGKADAAPRTSRRVALTLLTIALAISTVATARNYVLDARYAFSGAQEMAAFIHSEHLDDCVIAAHTEPPTSALCPYFRKPFWYLGIEEFGTFNVWDQKFERGLYVPYPIAVERFRARFRPGDRALLLLNTPMPNPPREGFELLGRTEKPVFAYPDERFWLYRRIR